MKFKDTVVVITGGGQGIGRVVSRAFANEGAFVVIADFDEEAGIENQNYINNNSGKAIFIKTDVAVEKDVINLLAKTTEIYGRVDILINNAGIGSDGDIFTRSMEEWDRVIAVNLRGTYMCSKYAAEIMRKQNKGIIINIASTRAFMSEPNTEPYSASKGGIISLTHSLAISLGEYGIRVNSISPGWIEVSENKKSSIAKVPHLSNRDHKQHPAGRVGKGEDIASACFFLASNDTGFITGTNIVIDGGMTVKMIYEE